MVSASFSCFLWLVKGLICLAIHTVWSQLVQILSGHFIHLLGKCPVAICSLHGHCAHQSLSVLALPPQIVDNVELWRGSLLGSVIFDNGSEIFSISQALRCVEYIMLWWLFVRSMHLGTMYHSVPSEHPSHPPPFLMILWFTCINTLKS